MKKQLLLLVALIVHGYTSLAQSDLFEAEKLPPHKGFIINVNGGIDFPAADMADRFGTSYKIGGAILYKTTSNWMFGPKIDFIVGSDIREDSLLSNIKGSDNMFYNQNGERVGVGIFERGYMIGIQAARIFNLAKRSSESGVMIMTSAGFMQHKINIFDRDNAIPQLRKEYKKGYDRLTNGLYLEQYVGYNFFSRNNLVNFHIGLDVTAGFTKGRRDYLYDVMRKDDASRLDVLFGIRGGWYIPIFKRKSEEIYFD